MELDVNLDGSLTRIAHEVYSPDPILRDEAARQLWLRFSDRLATVVRRRLDPRILRRAGLEDVMQSLFADYFAAGPGPNGPPRDRVELWRRLVRFTLYKIANTVDRHHAGRRDVRRERLVGDHHAPAEPADFRHQAPDEEAAAREEFARLLDVLPDDLRRVLAMRIEGYSNAEIAAEIGRVQRTVELKLQTIRSLLRPYVRDVALLDDEPEDSPDRH
jgi:DNA-directed RNA polymerase specialized sigma24 family protein